MTSWRSGRMVEAATLCSAIGRVPKTERADRTSARGSLRRVSGGRTDSDSHHSKTVSQYEPRGHHTQIQDPFGGHTASGVCGSFGSRGDRASVRCPLHANEANRPLGVIGGEFDPGSGSTLAACLMHASRTGLPSGGSRGGRVRSTWATCPGAGDSRGKPRAIPRTPPPLWGVGGKALRGRPGRGLRPISLTAG